MSLAGHWAENWGRSLGEGGVEGDVQNKPGPTYSGQSLLQPCSGAGVSLSLQLSSGAEGSSYDPGSAFLSNELERILLQGAGLIFQTEH